MLIGIRRKIKHSEIDKFETGEDSSYYDEYNIWNNSGDKRKCSYSFHYKKFEEMINFPSICENIVFLSLLNFYEFLLFNKKSRKK